MFVRPISSLNAHHKTKYFLYWYLRHHFKINYWGLRLTTTSLYAYHKTKELNNWYIVYLFNKSNWDLRHVEKRKIVRGVDVFDRLEYFHISIQKEVDDWAFGTKRIERQRVNLPPIQQVIKRSDRSEAREFSNWYSVDPEYLNRVERMIFEQRYLYGEPSKMIFIKRVLRLCTYRHYMEFWNNIDREERFLHWIKAKENHAKILAEREAFFLENREQNQEFFAAEIRKQQNEEHGKAEVNPNDDETFSVNIPAGLAQLKMRLERAKTNSVSVKPMSNGGWT